MKYTVLAVLYPLKGRDEIKGRNLYKIKNILILLISCCNNSTTNLLAVMTQVHTESELLFCVYFRTTLKRSFVMQADRLLELRRAITK